jgi:tetratricopeptide (TPR) repeat protein
VVFGDILRVLPHVVLGLVQGKRLRQQLAEEEEERQFARAQRAFELWRMQVAQQAFEQQQRMAQAVQQWLRSADLEPEPEPTEVTPSPVTPTAPTTTLPSLTTLPSPRERLAPQTPKTVTAPSPAEALKPQRSRRSLLPTPQLRLPSQIEGTPAPTAVPTTPTTPEVTGQPLIESGLRDIVKALSAAPQATAISQLQPQMTPAVMAKLSNLVHAGVMKVMRGIAREMVRQGLARNEWEAQEKADYWHQVLTVLTTSLPPNELLNPYIQRAQQQRDYWRQVEEKAREMRLRGIEAWGRLGEVFGKLGQQYMQRAERLRGWVFRLLAPITRLVEARMNVSKDVLQSELNALRFWLSQGRNVYVNLTDPHDIQRVQGLIDQVFTEIQREGAARQQTLEALQKALEKIQTDLSAKASLLEAIGERYEQAEIAIRLDAFRQLRKELGEPTPDISQVQRLHDFVLRGDIPEPPESGIEEADVPATPTQPSPTPTTPSPGIPSEELAAQPPPMAPPTATPPSQPTQPTQPTPPAPTATTAPTRPTPTTQTATAAPTHPFTALATRVILSAAEQREINEALQRLKLANERLRNELLRQRMTYEPQLAKARLRQINASIQRIWASIQAEGARLQQSAARLAWQQASRIFGGFVNLVHRLQTKDGKPIPPDKAIHYSTRLWGAALAYASGNAARAHKELQNIANEWKRAGYKLPERQDLLGALMAALGIEGEALPSPSGAPPQIPTKTPSPKTAPQTPQAPRRPSPPPSTFDIDEDELEDLLGGSPF